MIAPQRFTAASFVWIRVLPERPDVRVIANPFVFGHHDGTMVASSSYDHLIGRIAMKRLRKFAAFDQDWAGQFPDAEAACGYGFAFVFNGLVVAMIG